MWSPLERSANDPAPVIFGPAHPCPYLPDRDARFAYAARLPDGQDGFARLLNSGFRRSGLFVYRTACDFCQACRPIRVPAAAFRPTRSQRRAVKANLDLDVLVGPARLDPEKLALFRRYLAARHDGQMSADPEEIETGLFRSPVRTLEFAARREGRLKVLGIVDVAPGFLSLVYCAFEPDEPRQAYGTAFVQWAIAFAAGNGIPYVHLGYWIAGSKTMAYKANFRPHEVLDPSGTWRRADA